MFVEDSQRSKEFYARAFDPAGDVGGRELGGVQARQHDHQPAQYDHEAHDLIAPAPVAAPSAGSGFQLTIWVDDADATCEALAARGRDTC